jgi:hypothetical protein
MTYYIIPHSVTGPAYVASFVIWSNQPLFEMRAEGPDTSMEAAYFQSGLAKKYRDF